VIGQVTEPQIPELLIEMSFGRLALLIQRPQISKNLFDPLATNS
jgi:hypothetical protein